MSLTIQQRAELRKALHLDEIESGCLHDTRVVGDIADGALQRQANKKVTVPHDLFPRWFVVTSIVVGVIFSIAFYFFQPPPFWWRQYL